MGHTRARYECVAEFARAVRESGGTLGFTHLFNASGGIAGLEPGNAGAAQALVGSYAELIFDLNRVSEGALHLARAAKGNRLFRVGDCIRVGEPTTARPSWVGRR